MVHSWIASSIIRIWREYRYLNFCIRTSEIVHKVENFDFYQSENNFSIEIIDQKVYEYLQSSSSLPREKSKNVTTITSKGHTKIS